MMELLWLEYSFSYSFEWFHCSMKKLKKQEYLSDLQRGNGKDLRDNGGKLVSF